MSTATAETSVRSYREKTIGCIVGGAIGDAMGGPVECYHWRRIARRFPDFTTFLPYETTFPGYAEEEAPGNVTDDTYIRADFGRYVLETDPPYTAGGLAAWLRTATGFAGGYRHGEPTLRRIEAGEIAPEEAGARHPHPGGGALWQPFTVLFAGDPDRAAAVVADMARIWKGPLELDILAAMTRGHAAAFLRGATIDSVTEAVVTGSGPLAARLFTRAAEIARAATSVPDLHERLHRHCLVPEIGDAIDGPMPPHVDPVADTDEPYYSVMFAEQQPLALAYFIFGGGDARRTVLTAAKGGRDADSIAAASASLLGALAGDAVWPADWVRTVEDANAGRLSVLGLAERLADRGLALGRVALERI